MCCTCHFWSCSLCSFGFCLLVSSVSNFHPDTGRQHGLLFRFVCSAVLQAGGGCRRQMFTGLCGEHSQYSSHTGFSPTRSVCAFPIYNAQASGCSTGSMPWVVCGSSFRILQKGRLGWACVLCLPQPEQLRQPGAWWAHSSRVQRALSPPWSQPVSVHASWVCLVSVLGSWSLAATLPVDVNHPESQEVFG